MKTESLEEIARKLASLDDDSRRRTLLEGLGAEPESDPPAWLDQALAASQHLAQASIFAESSAKALTSPVPRPSERMRAVRFHGEEADAADLLGMVDCDVDGFGRGRAIGEEGYPAGTLVPGRQAALFLPTLVQAWERTTRGLELEADVEFQVIPKPEIEVSASIPAVLSERASFRILASAGALALPAGQLAFFMGRSLAELLYGHRWLRSLSVRQSKPTGTGHLAPDAEAVWLRWGLKAEFSADRAGLLASSDWGTAARALLLAELGLDGGVMTSDDRILFESVTQLSALSPTPASEEGANPPLHPLSLRLKALKCFEDDTMAAPSLREGREKADLAIEDLMRKNRRHPRSPRETALMEALAAGGIILLVSDTRIDNREGRLLVRILFEYFTDSPEEVLAEALDDPNAKLANALKELRNSGSSKDGEWLITHLVEIAEVDDVMPNPEFSVIASIAQELGVMHEVLVRLLVEGNASRGGSSGTSLT